MFNRAAGRTWTPIRAGAARGLDVAPHAPHALGSAASATEGRSLDSGSHASGSHARGCRLASALDGRSDLSTERPRYGPPGRSEQRLRGIAA